MQSDTVTHGDTWYSGSQIAKGQAAYDVLWQMVPAAVTLQANEQAKQAVGGCPGGVYLMQPSHQDLCEARVCLRHSYCHFCVRKAGWLVQADLQWP